jgi:hypothetical protein
MLEPLIEAIQEAVKPTQVVIDGRTYTTGKLTPIKETCCTPIHLSTLESFVDYIQTKAPHDIAGLPQYATDPTDFMILVNPYKVELFSRLQKDGNRVYLVEATAPRFSFNYNHWYEREEFQILLSQWFHQTPIRDGLLQYVANLKHVKAKEVEDDGISQTITTTAGTESQSKDKIKPLVTLQPRDHFPELDPIDRDLLIRMRTGNNESIQFSLFTPGDGHHSLNLIDANRGFLRSAITLKNIGIFG